MERKLRVNCGTRNSSAFFHYSSSINEPVALGINMHMYSIVLGRLIRSRDRINNHAALCAGWPLITDLLTSCTRPRVNYSSSSVAHPKNSSPGPKTSSRGGLMNTVKRRRTRSMRFLYDHRKRWIYMRRIVHRETIEL